MTLPDGELEVAGLKKSALSCGQSVLIDTGKDLLRGARAIQPCAFRRGEANTPTATAMTMKRVVDFPDAGRMALVCGGEKQIQ
jgi:hypothetical protein